MLKFVLLFRDFVQKHTLDRDLGREYTFSVSIISNSVLIIAIKTSATSSKDNYRYLLLCFAVGDMISSLSHSWISPIVHGTEHGFFFFPKHVNELKSENGTSMTLKVITTFVFSGILGKLAVLFYVMTYYETFNILAFHFIYRYRILVQCVRLSD